MLDGCVAGMMMMWSCVKSHGGVKERWCDHVGVELRSSKLLSYY